MAPTDHSGYRPVRSIRKLEQKPTDRLRVVAFLSGLALGVIAGFANSRAGFPVISVPVLDTHMVRGDLVHVFLSALLGAVIFSAFLVMCAGVFRSLQRTGGRFTRSDWGAIGLAFLGLVLFAMYLRSSSPFAFGLAFLCGFASLALISRRLREFAGPMLLFDLVRTARRGRLVSHRMIYLSCIIGLLYLIMNSNPNWDLTAALFSTTSTRMKDVALACQAFFQILVWLQFVVILLITPLYAAGAIAEEKQRHTLELYLGTPLSDREIVFGFLGARVANMCLLGLAGFPILGFIQFMGGIDPSLVLAAYVCSLATIISLGCLSILHSVRNTTPLGAIFETYPFLLYFAVLLGVFAHPVLNVWEASEPTQVVIGTALFLAINTVFAVRWLLLAVEELREHAEKHDSGTRSVHQRARHQLSAMLGTKAPASRSRVEGTRTDNGGEPRSAWVEPGTWIGDLEASPPDFRFHSDPAGNPDHNDSNLPSASHARSELRRAARQGPRPNEPFPAIGDNALVWKETCFEHHLAPDRPVPFLRTVTTLFVVLLTVYLCAQMSFGFDASRFSHFVAQMLGGSLIGLMALAAGLSAAGRVTREREGQTLDTLRTIPCNRHEILFAKWLGSFLSVRWLALPLLGSWIFGLTCGGLALPSIPLMLAASIVFVAMASSLGILMSTILSSTLRAMLFTALFGLLLLGGSDLLMLAIQDSRFDSELVRHFVDSVLSPHAIWFELSTYPARAISDGTQPWTQLLANVFGLQLFLLVALALWLVAVHRFEPVAKYSPIPNSSSIRTNIEEVEHATIGSGTDPHLCGRDQPVPG